MAIEFYDVKQRKKVSVPEDKIIKVRYTRVTKTGKTQTRYGLRGTADGTKLTKFVSQEEWERIDAPEE